MAATRGYEGALARLRFIGLRSGGQKNAERLAMAKPVGYGDGVSLTIPPDVLDFAAHEY